MRPEKAGPFEGPFTRRRPCTWKVADPEQRRRQTDFLPFATASPPCANLANVRSVPLSLQHQPLRDCDVHDHLPDAAQRGHAYFHLAKTQSVDETQVALPLSELALELDSMILFFILL